MRRKPTFNSRAIEAIVIIEPKYTQTIGHTIRTTHSTINFFQCDLLSVDSNMSRRISEIVRMPTNR